jgi:hypothetical protein
MLQLNEPGTVTEPQSRGQFATPASMTLVKNGLPSSSRGEFVAEPRSKQGTRDKCFSGRYDRGPGGKQRVRANPLEFQGKSARRRSARRPEKSFSQLVDNPMTRAILRALVEPDRFTVPGREIAEKTKVDGMWLVAILPAPF